jgi:arsenate reductase-like glutaredoxin family protein
LAAAELLNPNSKTFKAAGLALSSLAETEIVEFLAANPTALIRPLLSDGEKVAVGFDKAAFAALV